MLVLSGIAVIALGFLLRFNPLLVVAASALATGVAAGIDPLTLLATFGRAFNDSRFVTAIYLMLPVIGVLERYGLLARARALVAGMRGARPGRLLIGYMLLRQVSAALGLNAVAGHPQTVRPLVAPMAEAAAECVTGGDAASEEVRALAAATDNVALFFGEDIFLAVGSILLMTGVLAGLGIVVEPLALSAWAIPSAVAAALIHGARLLWLDRRLARTGPRR